MARKSKAHHLSKEQVAHIKLLLLERRVLKERLQLLTNEALAERFDVRTTTISDIATGKSHKG